jgi:hypothetical protein
MNTSTATMMALVADAHLAEGQLLCLRSIKQSKIWDFKSTREGRQFLKEKGRIGTLHRYSVISYFRSDVDEICALLGYYAASSGNFLPTFQNNLSVPSARVKISLPLQMGPTRFTTLLCTIAQISLQVLIRKSASMTPLLKIKVCNFK